jgi:tetratricopeptide (TPR) repeat protein
MTPLGARTARLGLLAMRLMCAHLLIGQEPHFRDLNEQAVKLYKEGKFTQAAKAELEAIRAGEATYGPDDVRIAAALNNLGSIYEGESQFPEAVEVYKRSLAITEKAFGPDNLRVAAALNNLALVYGKLGRYAEAEPLYRRALLIDEKTSGPESTNFATILINLGGLCEKQDRYAEAETLLRRALNIDEKALGPDDPHVATALNDLAALYKEQGRYAEAEPLYHRSLAIREKALGPGNRLVATVLNNLAAVYDDEGRYADAEELYRRALSIDEKALRPNDPDLAIDLNNLAELNAEQGKYGEAETLFQRALQIREKTLGPEHREVGMSLSNLASVYKAEGKYGEAEALYLRALKIDEAALGPDHHDVATVLNDLAGLYKMQGRQAEAEPLLDRAVKIDEKALGPDHPEVASDLNNLALLLEEEGKLAEVEPLYQRTLRIDEKALGPDHPKVATVLNNLGALYDVEGKFAESEQAYQRALRIQENALGSDHPDVGNTVNNLAVLFDTQGKYSEAEASYQRAMENLFHQFQYIFSYMTEKERLSFLGTVDERFPTYFSFVYRNHENDPMLSGAMYDLLLWEKGFVATSIADVHRRVEASGDAEALALLGQLSARRTQIAALLNSSPSNTEEWRKRIEQLRAEADEIEKSLVTRSAAFAEHRKLERATWQQVRDALHPGEAAVEFAHFRYFDKGWKSASIYVALVVRQDTRNQPQFIVLGEGKEIEGAALSQLQDVVHTRGLIADATARVPGAQAYEQIWKPVMAALTGVNRIYLSPDGALSQIPLGIVPSPDGKLLMERYDLRLVLSTKDILRRAPRPAGATALLVGDPDFALSEPEERAAIKKLTLPAEPSMPSAAVSDRSDGSRNAGNQTALPRLPGTGDEVNGIARLMNAHGWKSTVYTRELALKSVVEAAQSPRVLHLATHGFFLPDQKTGADPNAAALEDPMLRSGLYFAGADRTLAGKAAADLDNGVLTAMEESNMNLIGTELVVLSACNTGEGEVKNGEGVFGLRRALQEAGAQAVLMSLWSVPDKETLELMQQFYSRWLSGEEIHQALRDAQLAMRRSVKRAHGGRDLPYYWGAFVLVGR